MKKMFFLKKVASMILALLMIISTLVVVPFGASAEVTATENWTKAADGNYYIGSAGDMLAFAAAVAADTEETPNFAGETVKLTADIDMGTVTDWAPIAAFKGTFDGQDHTISNIEISATDSAASALFVEASGEIRNLILDNCNVTQTGTASACWQNGIVVQKGVGETLLLSNVHVKNSKIDAQGRRVGALVGYVKSPTTIENCSVINTVVRGGRALGSAVGQTDTNVTISKFYSDAALEGVTGYANPGNVGGLIGYLSAGEITYSKCVFAGSVACPSGQRKAGFSADIEKAVVLTMTDCALLRTDTELLMSSSTEYTKNLTRCVTANEFEAQKENLLANGWVETDESMLVGDSNVTILVPDVMFKKYLDHPFYASSCVTDLPNLVGMTVIADLGNKDATEIWQGGDKTSWGADEKVTLDATKTHMTFTFNAPQKAIYNIAVKYGKTTVDTSKALTVGFQVDDKEIDQITLTQSADADQWMIVSLELKEGDHIFTVYAPEDLGSSNINGKTVIAAELLAYKVWTKDLTPSYDYNPTFVEALDDKVPGIIVLDCGVNGATDSWDLEKTSEYGMGAAACLKPDFTPPRTHLGFTFTVETAGDYKFAVEYEARVNTSMDRSVDVQIDSLGRTRISMQQSDSKMYLVITEHLEAGTHTLTLYAPEAYNASNDDGKTIGACDLYSFTVYKPISAATTLDMVDGAAVKIASTSALRYTTRVDKASYDYLVELYGAENVTVGTLFGKASDVAIVGTLTKETFNREALTYYDSANGELLEDENGYYFYGYWEEDDTSNYDTMMAAVGYIRIKIEGKSNYLYVTHDANNDRSIAMVAERALADTKTASETGYENSVTANGVGAYSPYTSKQYACLVELAAYKKK